MLQQRMKRFTRQLQRARFYMYWRFESDLPVTFATMQVVGMMDGFETCRQRAGEFRMSVVSRGASPAASPLRCPSTRTAASCGRASPPLTVSPIVCIVTGLSQGSANGKTGTMLQTWILPRDVKPHHGFKDGRGASVCGDCPHAGYNQGSCYVKWFQAPLSVWNAYHRGSYEPIGQDWHLFTGRAVRFGAAGDPAMVPAEIWSRILEFCDSHTGYSHQWRQPWAQGLRGICQASCDGFADYLEASEAGWSCFLVAPKGATAPQGMAHCAASIERGQKPPARPAPCAMGHPPMCSSTPMAPAPARSQPEPFGAPPYRQPFSSQDHVTLSVPSTESTVIPSIWPPLLHGRHRRPSPRPGIQLDSRPDRCPGHPESMTMSFSPTRTPNI